MDLFETPTRSIDPGDPQALHSRVPQSPTRFGTPPNPVTSPSSTSAAAPHIVVAGDGSDSPRVRASTLAYGARSRAGAARSTIASSPPSTATTASMDSSDNSLDGMVRKIRSEHPADPLPHRSSSARGPAPPIDAASPEFRGAAHRRSSSTASGGSSLPRAHSAMEHDPLDPANGPGPASSAVPAIPRTPSQHAPTRANPIQPGAAELTPGTGQQHRRSHSRNHSHSHSHSHSQSGSQSAARKPQKRTSIGPWEFVKSIGAGSMGQVKLAVHKYTRQPAAVKIVPKAFTQRPRDGGRESNEARDARAIREAAIGRLLDHPNISKLYDVYSMTGHFYLVFEYIAGGQMLDYIITHGCVKEAQARRFARSIASALDYCHHNSVVHRDLKIENILIAEDGDVKLIDFGLSNLFRRDNLLKTFCGSLYFAAPELLNALPYVGPEIDVWSFGVVLYVLVSGKVPFEDKSMTVLHAKIKRGTVEYPTWLSSLCTDLLDRMLTVNPSERATLSEVMHHPWMLKGYEGPPDNFMPPRLPLHLNDIDPAVVEELANLGVGDASALTTHLQSIVTSAEYEAALRAWSDEVEYDMSTRSQATLGARMPDPMNSFAPELSFYYLARERLAKRTLSSASSRSDLGLMPAAMVPNSVPASQGEDRLVPGRVRAKTLGAAYTPAPVQQHTPKPQKQPLQQPQQLQPPPPPSQLQQQQQPQQQHDPRFPEISFPGKPAVAPHAGATYGLQKSLLPTPESSETSMGGGEDSADAAAQLEPAAAFVSRIASNGSSNGQASRVSTANAAVPLESRFDRVPVLPSTPRTTSGSVVVPSSEPPPSIVPTSPNQQLSSIFRRLSLRRRDVSMAAANTSVDRSASAAQANKHMAGHARAKSTSYAMRGGVENKTPSNTPKNGFASTSGTTGIGPSMPSIEAPRHVFFRGIFSVQSTSTKPLREIRAEIIRVLTQMNIEYVEVMGGFACVAHMHRDVETVPSTPKGSKPVRPGEPYTPRHRRGISDNATMSPALSSNASSDSVEMEIGASDMLGVDSEIGHAQIPIRFEIDIVRVPIVSLHGVQFKKMTGNVWQYKNLAQEILNQLRI